MATTIQDFFTRAAAKQFSRDFLFRVKQVQLTGGVFLDGESDLVYARTAALPGREIENKTVNYFGQDFQVPGRSTYNNAAGYTLNFYHDENCELRTKLKFDIVSRVLPDLETTKFNVFFFDLKSILLLRLL